MNFKNLSKDNLKEIRLVKDNHSKITLENEEIASEINSNFKYYYESGIFNEMTLYLSKTQFDFERKYY